MTATVDVRALSHRYATPNGPLPVLTDVTFDIPSGGYVALTGPSGAGKTTLLSLLGGLDTVQQGGLTVDGTDVQHLRGSALAAYRRTTVGFIFQHFGLLDTLTALENVELARTLAGAPRRVRRHDATELLSAVGLLDRVDHLPHQLSGGERQRVAIARALANEPRLLLADEPTGNLDERSAEAVMDLLERFVDERGVTLLVVTHNRYVAARARTRLSLDAGRLIAPAIAAVQDEHR